MDMTKDQPTTTDATICEVCHAGRFSNANDESTQCSECQAGQYQELAGQTSCKENTCKPGSYLKIDNKDTKHPCAQCVDCVDALQ